MGAQFNLLFVRHSFLAYKAVSHCKLVEGRMEMLGLADVVDCDPGDVEGGMEMLGAADVDEAATEEDGEIGWPWVPVCV